MTHHLSKIFSSITGLLSTRFHLLGIELQEEIERLISLTLLVAATAVFASMFFILATILLIVLFWDEYRIWVASGLTVMYGGLALGFFLMLKQRLANAPTPFATLAGEFEKDRHILFRDQQEDESA